MTPRIKPEQSLRAYKSGAAWFYWIAAISLINGIVAASGGTFSSSLGLAFAALLDALVAEAGGAARIFVMVIHLCLAGALVIVGMLARRGYLSAYVAGYVFLALDTLLSAVLSALGGWLYFIVKLVIMLFLTVGLVAGIKLRKSGHDLA